MMSFQWESVQEQIFSVLADGLNSYCSANDDQFKECCHHDPYRYLKLFPFDFKKYVLMYDHKTISFSED